jgi:putative acetyltransferase
MLMIRKAIIEDVSRIAEILIFSKRVAYRSIFRNDKISFGEMQVYPLANQYIKNPKLLENIFVYDDEFVKGIINISFCDSNSVEINELYIDPFFQKQNIGNKLLEYIEMHVRNLGNLSVFLWVLENNRAARMFYEKQKFLITTEKRLEEGTEEYIVKYQKLLN